MKPSEKVKISTTRVAVMGLSGTGKSTLVADLSKTFKLWWFTLDNDSDILLKLPPEQQDNIELFDIPDSASFPVAADTLMKLFEKKSGKICHKHGMLNCALCAKQNPEGFSSIDLTSLDPNKDIVVIDTGSQLSHSILAHATKDKPVDHRPERDTWGTLRKWTEFFYSEFQAARFNLIVIFHSIEAELEDGKTKLVPSFGSKDMSTKIAGAFSHVVYTDLVNRQHKAISKSTASSTVLSKSRTDFDISSLPTPSLIPIFSKEYTSTPPPEVAKAIKGLQTIQASLSLKK
jgi:hypothetical protein